ncbi:MAG: M81 family metallopeptidase [Oscillospiraceae bacterium]|nr:M81 family metallopeptidase [Oscillospiraceae bacterium]
MKIAVGAFLHEANSFNPRMIDIADFHYLEGEAVFGDLAAVEVFRQAGAEVVPLISASDMTPNGIVKESAYEYFAGKMLSALDACPDADAVYLYCHGAMEVENIGSGEYELVRRIREKMGPSIVMGIALDAHANTDPRLPGLVNAIRNYRTVPHTDMAENERAVAAHMVTCLREQERTVPQYVRLPYAIHPEKALGNSYPLKNIFERLFELEKDERIAIATLGIGAVWCDCATLATHVIVTPSRERDTDYALEQARLLADYVYSFRDEYDFQQLPLSPHEAARYSVSFEGAPVYVSDSGDNTTGGAVGDHTILLREYLHLREYFGKKVLVTSIWDEKAVAQCLGHKIDDQITVSIGHDTDDYNRAVTVTGTLKAVGAIWGGLDVSHIKAGDTITLDLGHVDVTLLSCPGSFVDDAHFEAAGLDLSEYQVVVVKQGYLFPELRQKAKLGILALTPGATHQILENLTYRRIHPPVYPLHYCE